jgi:hypothetical protein
VSVAESVPYVVIGFVGAGLTLRWDRLRSMMGLDAGRAVLISVIPVTYLLGLHAVALLIAVAALVSCLDALFDPALQAVVPDLVSPEQLQPMIALTDSTDRLARVLGPGAAGIVLSLLPEIHLFSIDAASFLVSAACLALISARSRRDTPAPVARPPRAGILDGLHEVAGRPDLARAVALRGCCNLVWTAFTIGAPFLIVHKFHAGLATYGLLLAAFGAGNLGGLVLSANRRVGEHLLAVYCAAWTLVGVGFLALAAAPTALLAGLATLWMGLFTPVANVSMDTYIAATVSAERLVLVYSLQRNVVVGASAVGAFAVAGLLEATSATVAVAAAGGWMIGAGLLALARTTLSSAARPAR